MRCRILQIGLVLLVGIFAGEVWLAARTSSVTPDRSLPDLLDSVENKYNRLRTVRLRFVQLYRQDQQTLRKEEGTLYIRKPGQMRWEYEAPEPKLFLTDGKQLVLYVPSENRATQMAVKDSADIRTPLRFLLGNLRFGEEFSKIEDTSAFPPLEAGNRVLRAYPKRLEERLEWVIFEVTAEDQIRRVILSEPGGTQTEFRFDDEQSNLTLSPQLFRFQPPAGTEIVQE